MLLFLLFVAVVWIAFVLARMSSRVETLEREFRALNLEVSKLFRRSDDEQFRASVPALAEPDLPQAPEPADLPEPASTPFGAPSAWPGSAPPELAVNEARFDAPSAAEAHPAAPHSRDGSDLERVIAGSWLNRIGILTLLIGTAFFLKFAFDNNWIGPTARIATGLVAGISLLAYSQALFKKGFAYFSEGMVALGGGVLYLSLYAGWDFYHKIPVPLAFAGMVAVTATILGLALARNSQRLAFLALVGGFVTPLLLNTGKDNEVGLFTYLAVLNGGLLWVSLARNWRSLPIAFLFTLFYGVAWYAAYYDPSKLGVTAFFTTLFYVEFGILPAVCARQSGTLPQEHLPLVLFNSTWYTFIAADMLYERHRLLLAVLMLALAAAHYMIARLSKAHEPPLARSVYEALSYTFLAIATGVGLRGPWVTIGWAVEGAALVLAGLRGRNLPLRVEGLALFIAVIVRLIVTPHDAGRFLFNPELATFAAVIGCIGFAAYRAYRQCEILAVGELALYKAAGAAANALILWALSRELWNLQLSDDVRAFSLTLFWSVYAGALVLVGNMRRSRLFVWQGIALLALAIVIQPLVKLFIPAEVAWQTPWIVMLWAFEGALFVWRGVHWRMGLARAAGQILLYVAAGWALAGNISGGMLAINPRFATLAFIIACFAIALTSARIERSALSSGENTTFDIMAIAINTIALWALSDEVLDIKSLGQEPMQLLLTLLWTVYAGVLMMLGLRRSSPLMRWQSLALLGLVIGKVFLFDLSVLPLGLRILSFFGLGLALVAVSFFYQRRVQTRRADK